MYGLVFGSPGHWPSAMMAPLSPPFLPSRARSSPAPTDQQRRDLASARPLHCGRSAARTMGATVACDLISLRVLPLRRQTGLGLPVRRVDGGAADRHAPVVSARRRAQPLRLPVP